MYYSIYGPFLAPKQPKCGGKHNEGGISQNLDAITTHNFGTSFTFFGEWPHVCILQSNGIYIGGASLIAPGVILTAAHLVV